MNMNRLLFMLYFCASFSSASCNASNNSDDAKLLCCRNGRDGRDGLSIMGPKGCKGDPGKDGIDGKDGKQGKCDESKLNSVMNELANKENLRKALIGHWKMDEEIGFFIDDDSGHGNHGVSTGESPHAGRGKYSRGRYFRSGGSINVPNSKSMKLGENSFSFTGWVKSENFTYPMTDFAVRQGFGCYFAPGRSGFTAGWDIGHGFKPNATEVCIRDHENNKAWIYIKHNAEENTSNLLGKWTHYAVVFNRVHHKIQLYINAKKQHNEVDISNVTGSVDNNRPLTFGGIYGWKTNGTIDDYRFYNIALNLKQVAMIYNDL